MHLTFSTFFLSVFLSVQTLSRRTLSCRSIVISTRPRRKRSREGWMPFMDRLVILLRGKLFFIKEAVRSTAISVIAGKRPDWT